ncbi:FAD-dependent oxidoreductase [Ancylothrix sp. C2]|uniref:NAD(P)/FAD-dependent oxidoreductase n=1 Tax=Ancylothrix sp. D3o TaxID=2953691 RepID=UPI0021BB2825|nr:FAD-dependent oxidoreductase [Ancylothrix sp. D3o]MCT7950722.1 FAD-dependent oxidoreductase [Ancylothrix sp. D3o]
MTEILDVAVIGAGISGLVSASLLRHCGYSVAVIEKSRGVGGRLATRRIGDTIADHGARYLEPKGDLLQGLIHELSEHRIIEPWTNTTYLCDPTTASLSPTTSNDWTIYYAAPTGMNAIGKFLASGLEIFKSQRLVAMTPTAEETWQLSLEIAGTPEPTSQTLQAKAVVLAIPAPQAVPLIEPNKSFFSLDFFESLCYAEYDPCLSVMAGYPPTRNIDLNQRATAWRSVSFPENYDLAWAGWDSSKRQLSEKPLFVFHSSAEYAEKYLDEADLQPAATHLLNLAGKSLISWLNAPEWVQIQRWRYAFVRRPIPQNCLISAKPVPVVCCGDWCAGGQIEVALKSGIAAAGEINTHLQQRSLPGKECWNLIARAYRAN